MSEDLTTHYLATIDGLEAEVAKLRGEINARAAQIDEARNMIIALRRRIDVLAAEGTDGTLALFPKLSKPSRVVEGPRKGDVKDLVLSAIKERPGVSGSEIVDEVESRIESAATDKRKLAFSTISYLLKRGLVHRQGTGLFAADRDPRLMEDDAELPY